MDWNSLSAGQKHNARRLQEALNTAGVAKGGDPLSVSQVAKFYDDVVLWDHSTLSLDTLCKKAYWTPPPAPDREELYRKRSELREALAIVEKQIAELS